MPSILGSCLAGAEDRGECVERGGDQCVEGPLAALVPGEDPGVDEDLQMVRDRRLGQAKRAGQITDTRLAALVCGDHRHQPQPGGLGQGLEDPCQAVGLAGRDRLTDEHRAAAVTEDRQLGTGRRGGGSGAHQPSMRDALTIVYPWRMLFASTDVYAKE